MKRSYFIMIVSVCFISCYTPRYMYSPSAQNIPLLVKQGDSKLSANYSTDLSANPLSDPSSDYYKKKSRGFDLHGSVAITNSIAIQANYFNRTERNSGGDGNLDSVTINYKRTLTEIGLGYFKSLHPHNKVMFQVFAGVGKGVFSFTDKGKDQNNDFYSRNHSADVLKVYLQSAILFLIKDNFALSVSTRLSIIQFRNIKTDYSDTELADYRLDNLAKGSHTFWEPAFTNTFGFNKLRGVKFEYQLGTAFRISERMIDYRSFNFSLGLLLDIPKIIHPAPVND